MKSILYLTLPALLAAACGESAKSLPDSGPDLHTGPDGDATSDGPDVRANDDGPVINVDVSASEGPLPNLDVAAPDGPLPNLDAPEVGDDLGPQTYPDLPAASDTPAMDAFAVDGPDRDLHIITLWFPDGRTATVNEVASCEAGALYADPQCPATYAEGLAKAMVVDSGWPLQETAAGQCAEGAYVYLPYLGLDSTSCYYGPDGKSLLAVNYCSDVTHECTTAAGTASNCSHYGTLPPCTSVTWKVQRW
jgi:hypothetical protein